MITAGWMGDPDLALAASIARHPAGKGRTTSMGSSVNAASSAKATHDGDGTPRGGPALLPDHTSAESGPRAGGKEVRVSSGEVGARTSPPLVVGLDLSLASTGLAHLRGERHVTDVLRGKGHGIVRLRRLVAAIREHVDGAALVVVEGPAYSKQAGQKGHHERAGLYWLVQDRLVRAEVPFAIVPPSTLKLYALGKGGGAGTDKTAVTLAASRRLGYLGSNDNEADALWLAHLGRAWLTGEHPVPNSHRRALDGCAWPA